MDLKIKEHSDIQKQYDYQRWINSHTVLLFWISGGRVPEHDRRLEGLASYLPLLAYITSRHRYGLQSGLLGDDGGNGRVKSKFDSPSRGWQNPVTKT